jgi:hypothetical protein
VPTIRAPLLLLYMAVFSQLNNFELHNIIIQLCAWYLDLLLNDRYDDYLKSGTKISSPHSYLIFNLASTIRHLSPGNTCRFASFIQFIFYFIVHRFGSPSWKINSSILYFELECLCFFFVYFAGLIIHDYRNAHAWVILKAYLIDIFR